VTAALVLAGLQGGFLQGQVDNQALMGLEVGPKVEVSVFQRSHVVTSALDIYVKITNLTKNDIFVKNVQVIMPGPFLAAHTNFDLQSTSQDLTNQKLKPGYQRLVPIQIPQQQLGWVTPIRNHQLLAFVPGEYNFSVVVTYAPDEIPPVDSETIEIAKITLEPPLSSLIWGGVLGAVLLALFWGVFDYSRQGSPRNTWNTLKKTAVISVAGAVSASIALLLLQRLNGLELPINLTVTDFYGGVTIGLFSYKIGDWLHKELVEGGTQDSVPKP
jgi:hypothetical protein